MRILSKEEKSLLELLLNHKGFKLLESLTKEFEQDVLLRLKNIDLNNGKDLIILGKNQNYLKGVEDFINTIKTKTNKIGKRDFS